MRKKATVFRGAGVNKSNDEELRTRKRERDRARYQRQRAEILQKQAKYYKDNRDDIIERRADYTEKYNKKHSVRYGDKRYQQKRQRQT